MTSRSTTVSFTGRLSYDELAESSARTLVLDDSGVATEDDLRVFGPAVADCREFRRRPNSEDVDELAAHLRAQRVERLGAIGSGALIDAAKIASLRVQEATGRELELAFVPCGPEPYRAVAPFAVVDDVDGSRPTAVDPRFAAAEVGVLPWLLERLPERALATVALDTSVHAIESLLSSRATPMTRLLAGAALRSASRPDFGAPATLLTACFLAVEAFVNTALGLAHAVASPLGTELGITHDTINGVLGEPLLEFWGAASCTDPLLAAGGAEDVGSLGRRLRDLRRAAQLPSRLDELGASWPAIARILPRAAASSGMAVLPVPVEAEELEAFARRAWSGDIGQEVRDAELA